MDGLRAISVLAVFGFHFAQDLVPGGFLGVGVFFLLSGYLITSLLLEEHERTGTISFARFYGRRALRLYPALVVMVCGGLLISAYDNTLWEGLKAAAASLIYLTNIAQVVGVVGGVDWAGHTWSLAVEEQFYLVWPIALLLALRQRWNPLTVTVAAIVVAAVVRAVLSPVVSRGVIYVLPIGHIDELMIGAALAVVLRSDRGRALLAMARSQVAAIACGIGLGAAILLTSVYDQRWLHYGGTPLLSLVVALIVAHTLTRPQSLPTRFLSLTPLTWLGRRSYGFYLYQQLFHAILVPTDMSVSGRTALGLVLSLLAAAVSYRFVELPFLRRKRRLAVVELDVPALSPRTGDEGPPGLTPRQAGGV